MFYQYILVLRITPQHTEHILADLHHNIPETCLWFCSIDCFQKALRVKYSIFWFHPSDLAMKIGSNGMCVCLTLLQRPGRLFQVFQILLIKRVPPLLTFLPQGYIQIPHITVNIPVIHPDLLFLRNLIQKADRILIRINIGQVPHRLTPAL